MGSDSRFGPLCQQVKRVHQWQRLGLLKPGEKFDRARYVGCVSTAAKKLIDEDLLLAKVAAYYTEQARKKQICE